VQLSLNRANLNSPHRIVSATAIVAVIATGASASIVSYTSFDD